MLAVVNAVWVGVSVGWEGTLRSRAIPRNSPLIKDLNAIYEETICLLVYVTRENPERQAKPD